MIIERFILQARLFINKTIGELLFDGYDDEVIQIADDFVDYNDDNHEEYDYFEEYYEEYDDGYSKAKEKAKDKVKTEAKIPMDKFGWFYKVNIIMFHVT